MNRNLKTSGWFLFPALLFCTALLLLVLLYSKGALHLMMNGYHTPFLDTFFKYFTEMGASIPFIIAALLLFHKMGVSLYLFGALLLNSLLTNSLKMIFREPRPKSYFEMFHPDTALQFVDGVTVHAANGFPSGHTSATFVLMMCLSLVFKNRYLSFVCFLLAVLSGYSRIYLSQHFTEDVLFGAAVGMTVALTLFPAYRRLTAKVGWAEKPLYTVLKPKRLK